MSTIKLNTDCICFGNLASIARSLQENSQSERLNYCSHIIKLCDKQQDNRKFVNEPMTIIFKKKLSRKPWKEIINGKKIIFASKHWLTVKPDNLLNRKL